MRPDNPLSQLSPEEFMRIAAEAAEDGDEPILMTRREYDAMVLKIVRRAITIPLIVISVLAILGGAVWLSGLTGC